MEAKRSRSTLKMSLQGNAVKTASLLRQPSLLECRVEIPCTVWGRDSTLVPLLTRVAPLAVE